MEQEKLIRSATFNPRVKTYWLLNGALILLITIVGIPLLLLWFPLGMIFTGRYLGRMSCELTNKALKVRKGLWVRTEKTIPLEKITDMGMVQGPIMRWLGIERLTVETAGQSGAGALVSLAGIEHAQEFREAVLNQRDEFTSQRSSRRSEATDTVTPGGTQEGIHQTLLRIEALLVQQQEDSTKEDQGPF